MKASSLFVVFSGFSPLISFLRRRPLADRCSKSRDVEGGGPRTASCRWDGMGLRADFRVCTVLQFIPLIQDLERWECELGIKTETYKFLEDSKYLE